VYKEFKKRKFQDTNTEKILEDWLEKNPESLFDDSDIMIIGRQVTTNFGGAIDLLGVNRQGDLAIIELKRGKAPRDIIAQCLDYASFIDDIGYEQLEEIFVKFSNGDIQSLSKYHKEYFHIADDEAVAFNKDQILVIVGEQIDNRLLQTAEYISRKGIGNICIKFSFFEVPNGDRIMIHDTVFSSIRKAPKSISSKQSKIVDKETFLNSLNQFAKPVFKKIFEFADKENLSIHWGTKGFSLNAIIDDEDVSLCYGYPPSSVFKQAIYTGLYGPGSLSYKTDASSKILEAIESKALETELFIKSGQNYKWIINDKVSDEDIGALMNWLYHTYTLYKKTNISINEST
ncbi:MAG: hypothetical protein ACLFSQ_00960, partial [Candidatus Zixiibacteriota bacterium]